MCVNMYVFVFMYSPFTYKTILFLLTLLVSLHCQIEKIYSFYSAQLLDVPSLCICNRWW